MKKENQVNPYELEKFFSKEQWLQIMTYKTYMKRIRNYLTAAMVLIPLMVVGIVGALVTLAIADDLNGVSIIFMIMFLASMVFGFGCKDWADEELIAMQKNTASWDSPLLLIGILGKIDDSKFQKEKEFVKKFLEFVNQERSRKVIRRLY